MEGLKTPKFKVGDGVECRKATNALGRYFACEVTAVRSVARKQSAGWYSEKGIAARLFMRLCTCGLLFRTPTLHFYNV